MPRERKWSFDGITCDYVDEGQDSYYEIKIAIMPLKEKRVLEPLQLYLADLDEACSIGGKTTLRNKLGHITQLRFVNSSENDVNALCRKVVQLGLPVIPSSPPSIASVLPSISHSSSSSSSSSSLHPTQTQIDQAEQVDIEQSYVSENYTHNHESYTPGLTDEAKRLAKQIQEHPETVYKAWCHTTPKENPNFSGRENLLRVLIARFSRRDNPLGETEKVLYQTAMGLGGVGKTQVVARYVNLCRAQQQVATGVSSATAILKDIFKTIPPDEQPSIPEPYHAIIWLDASDETSLLRAFRSVGETIGLVFEPKQASDLGSVRDAVYTRLGHLPRVLLVWDGVSQASQIQKHLPTSNSSAWRGTCDCLLTTRDRLLAERYHGLEVGLFSTDESVAYLKQALAIEAKPDNELENLAATLGHLPLALSQAAAYINRQQGQVGIREYLTRYASNRTELLDKLPTVNDRYLETVLTTWLLSMVELSRTQQGSQAVRLLLSSSFLSGQCIEYDVLQAYMKQSEVGLEELVGCLSHYSLVDGLSEQPGIRVHRLVQDVIQLWLKGSLTAHVRKSAWNSQTRGAKVSSSMDELANNLSLQKVHHTWFSLANTLKNGLLEMAKLKKPTMAELVQRKTLLPHLDAFISRLNYPPESLTQIPSSSPFSLPNRLAMDLYHNQGIIAMEHGYYQQAKRALEACLSFQKNYYGEQHVVIARTLSNLGNVLGNLGDNRANKELLKRALLIQEAYYGYEHVTVATTLVNLGNVLLALSDYQAAKDFLERALWIYGAHYGKNHIQVPIILGNLGVVVGALGDHQAKKDFLERALVIKESHYGKEHVEVAATLVNLGIVLGALGDFKAKKALLERALGIFQAHYGEEHVKLVRIFHSLGVTKAALGFPQEAMKDLQRAFRLAQSTTSDKKHPWRYWIAYEAKILLNQYPEDFRISVEEIGVEASSIQRWLLSPEVLAEADSSAAEKDAKFQMYAGSRYVNHNQPESALRYYQQAIALAPATSIVYHRLASCYHAIGQLKEAKQWFEKGIANCPMGIVHVEYAQFLMLQKDYTSALVQIKASQPLAVSGFTYQRMYQPLMLPLLQTLFENKQTITLPTDGLGFYLAYECHLALNQPQSALAARDQLAVCCEGTIYESLTELYALVLSITHPLLQRVEGLNVDRSSQVISVLETPSISLSSSSSSLFQPAGFEEKSNVEGSVFSPSSFHSP